MGDWGGQGGQNLGRTGRTEHAALPPASARSALCSSASLPPRTPTQPRSVPAASGTFIASQVSHATCVPDLFLARRPCAARLCSQFGGSKAAIAPSGVATAQAEVPKAEAPKVIVWSAVCRCAHLESWKPRVEAPHQSRSGMQVEAPKVEAPKVEAPKVEAPKDTTAAKPVVGAATTQPKVRARRRVYLSTGQRACIFL